MHLRLLAFEKQAVLSIGIIEQSNPTKAKLVQAGLLTGMFLGQIHTSRRITLPKLENILAM